MKKNILIVTGSPRKNGNTDLMAEAFKKGAEANGHKVTIFNTTSEQIGGCIACDTCWSKGKACSLNDGFTSLEPLLEEADTIVFASPLYWFGFSAQLKAAIDKLYSYVKENALRPLKIKESILLTCGGTSDLAEFGGLIETYKWINNYLKWNDKGIHVIPSVNKKGDIKKGDSLKKIENAGMNI